MAYLFLICFWGLTIKGLMSGDAGQRHRMSVFLYILPPVSILILWWFSSVKKVFLQRDALIVSGGRREARIPVSQIEKVHEGWSARGVYPVVVKFKASTDFRRTIRILTGSEDDAEKVARLLRAAMEGKDIGVKINRLSSDTLAPDEYHKEIIVRGWTDAELSGILTDFADMYEKDLGKKFEFAVCPVGDGATRVTFPHDIPGKQFSYLINYLNYPKNYDLDGRSLSIIGKAVLSQAFHLPGKGLFGKPATFYVPSNDEDYDVVYIRVGEETFENSFAGLRWKKVNDPRLPNGSGLS